MVVNDNACELDKRGALESIASNRASTGCSYRYCVIGVSRDCVMNQKKTAYQETCRATEDDLVRLQALPNSFLSLSLMPMSTG
jgi:hypothetical protein